MSEVIYDYSDRCPACGSAFAPRYGAFACGYPSADCPVMVAEDQEDEEYYAEYEIPPFDQVVRRGSRYIELWLEGAMIARVINDNVYCSKEVK